MPDFQESAKRYASLVENYSLCILGKSTCTIAVLFFFKICMLGCIFVNANTES